MERIDLKIFRIKQGLTQEEFAKKIGISRQSYLLIEAGKRDFKFGTLKKFKKAFNLTEEQAFNLMKKGVEKIER